MIFKVHVKLAKTALSELKDKNLKIGRKAFIFGNVFPDLILPHMPAHRKNASQHFFDKQHTKICGRRRKNAMKIHVWDSFLLGILSHYAADYSCAAHRESYNENMRAHRRHEKAQLLFLKDHPHVLSETGGRGAGGNQRVSSLIGNGRTDSLSDELVGAMDAIRLTCAGLITA